MKKYIYLFLSFLILFPAFAAEKSAVPRFVSLRPNEVNARVGPGSDYPVEWVFTKAGLPVEVIAEFDTWRRIRDFEGSEGWVHKNMLCSKRRAIINCPEVVMHSKEDPSSSPLARLQKGVIVDLLTCRGEWCRVQVIDFKGWIPRCFLWGIYSEEIVG